MSDTSSEQTTPSPEEQKLQGRRLFLRGLGKWSGAAITAAVAGAWLASSAPAGAWINRRGGWLNRGGGGWINGGGWVNRSGGWLNRGGGGWVNRRGGGGGSWINRW